MGLKSYFRKRVKSFSYAYKGICVLLKEEPNFRIHLIAAALVVVAGFCFKLNLYEWVAIVLSIGFVLVTEALNTSIENMADFVSPDKNEAIKRVKDVAAGAVLFSALTAVIVGFLVFIPKIIK